MNEKSPRSQLVTKIKAASSILVTVSHDPNVDQLAAALGLTFMLDKMGKHATAVFSGEIPPAINFLEPEKTFEGSVDSLRDFVISLDKEKADRLRYKVEGDLVKIYITPYKTTISEKDLEFNEGDFNIELVIAIGVDQKDHLDAAITANGRLLHDATVATMVMDPGDKSAFGTINWQDAESSTFSEMVANLADDLSDKESPLLDEQISTALLTGVVAATDQFRNEKTSANVMTLAANLMAKGANQQLIASELSAAGGIPTLSSDSTDETEKVEEISESNQSEEGTLMIDRGITPEANDHIATDTKAVAEEHNQDALSVAQEQLAAISNAENITPESEPISTPTTEPVPMSEPELSVPERPTTPDIISTPSIPEMPPLPTTDPNSIPSATSGEAELDTLVANNNTILTHSSPYVESTIGSPLNSAIASNDEPPAIDPFAAAKPPAPAPMIDTVPAPPSFAPPTIELPPPPPPPPTDLGQLPPLPGSEPAPTQGLPPLPTQDTPVINSPATDPMFPQVDTEPVDPAQYQIPS